jgi:hypothetical protein
LSDFYSYRLIGKLTVFLHLQEFNLCNLTVTSSTSDTRISLNSSKSGLDLTLVKESVLRIMLNLDGTPITSKPHTHPSHSQTSRLLTSSLFLGVPVLRSSLSSHRHSYTGLVLNSRFIDLIINNYFCSFRSSVSSTQQFTVPLPSYGILCSVQVKMWKSTR